ncbi:4Fe-4S dicluster domain-containing protein [Flavonifractor hominis]|uniref:4Fe-4S dicluster domain-containing protein n=1 Tax=Flavonifractor hominis TaxID=3133178 RepID=A0ABV1EPL8_9FIRM
MRVFETNVQELKNDVLRSVAKLAWDDDLQSGILDIPERIIPGPEAKMRCCIYKERAIISQRVKVAMGGDKSNPNLVEVLPIACDECPVTEITVGPSCRGCIATRCVHACPKDAITIVDHKAVIDHKKCITCGRCIAACPYGAIEKKTRPCERGCKAGAISMGEDKKAFIDPTKCTSCGACIYQCPFGAIMDKSFIVDAIQMLQGAEKWGYHVYAIVAPSIAGQFAPANVGQVVTGLKRLGFQDVMEVALGADMTARTEAAELEEKGMLASSCCPAFVDYVQKNFPQQAHLISDTPSPMVMVARHIKRQDPTAKVIFIGPCVAKKMEVKLGKTMRAVDCALTFEELYAMFEARDIDPVTLEEGELDQASGYGRTFARSGGVSAAVVEALKERGSEFAVKPMPCSGFEACKVAFLKAAKGAGDFNFIEGMACEGGCVQGPAQLIRSPRNQGDVERHAKQAEGRTITAALERAETVKQV